MLRNKKKRFMLLGKLGSDKWFTCGPNHLHCLSTSDIRSLLVSKLEWTEYYF